MEDDIAVVIPTADFNTPENRDNSVPGVEPQKPPKKKKNDLPLRLPRRSGRERTVVQPHSEATKKT